MLEGRIPSQISKTGTIPSSLATRAVGLPGGTGTGDNASDAFTHAGVLLALIHMSLTPDGAHTYAGPVLQSRFAGRAAEQAGGSGAVRSLPALTLSSRAPIPQSWHDNKVTRGASPSLQYATTKARISSILKGQGNVLFVINSCCSKCHMQIYTQSFFPSPKKLHCRSL